MFWDINNVKADIYKYKEGEHNGNKYIKFKKPIKKFKKTISPYSEYTNIQDLIIFLRDLENYQMNEHEELKFDIKFDIKFEC